MSAELVPAPAVTTPDAKRVQPDSLPPRRAAALQADAALTAASAAGSDSDFEDVEYATAAFGSGDVPVPLSPGQYRLSPHPILKLLGYVFGPNLRVIDAACSAVGLKHVAEGFRPSVVQRVAEV